MSYKWYKSGLTIEEIRLKSSPTKKFELQKDLEVSEEIINTMVLPFLMFLDTKYNKAVLMFRNQDDPIVMEVQDQDFGYNITLSLDKVDGESYYSMSIEKDKVSAVVEGNSIKQLFKCLNIGGVKHL